jgi:4-carboxymuconolactone decarboxylase
LGEQQVVDLVAVTGTYVTLAMLLSVSEATVPEGKEEPFKPGD